MSENRYELPKGWAWTTLVDSCCCVPTGIERFAGTVEYYSTGSIKTFSCTPEGTYTFSKRPSRANRLAKKRDVFQARMAGTNKALLIGNALEGKLFSTGFIQLREYSCSHGMHSYIYYYVESPYFLKQRDTYATGSTQVALTDAGLRKIAFPLAPLNEQKRIVIKIESLLDPLNKSKQELAKIPPLIKKFRQSVLARAFNGELTKDWRSQQKDLQPASNLLERIRNERKKQLGKKYKEPEPINTSVLPELPEGWKWINLNFICEDIYRYPTFYGLQHLKSGIPVIRGEHIQKDGEISVDWSNFWFVSKEISDKFPRTQLKVDNLVMSVRGSIGKIGIIDKAHKNAQLSPNCIRISPIKSTVDSRYLWNYLRSAQGQISVFEHTSATTINTIKASAFKETLIPLPPLAEQKLIAEKIKKFFVQTDAIEKSVKIAQGHCEKINQSILTKAFRGELVPQDSNDKPASVLLEKIKVKKEKRKKITNKKIRTEDQVKNKKTYRNNQ